MHPTFRAVLAVCAGIAVGILLISVGQAFTPYSTPPGVDYNDAAAYSQWLLQLPDAVFAWALAIYLIASFAGGFTAGRIIPGMAFTVGFAAGFALLFYAVVTFLAFPNPAWVTYVACVGCVALGILGGWLGKRVA